MEPVLDDRVIDEVEQQVRSWLEAARRQPVDRSAQRLADVLKDPHGLAFTVGFVDGVIRPEDSRVAAHNLRALTADVPGTLPRHLRLALRIGALAALLVPGMVIPVIRAVLRRMVGHLLVDATDRRLGPSLTRIRRAGVATNVNLLGEAVLGAGEARRRLAQVQRLLERPDVDYVSIKVSATVAPHNPWAFEEAAEDVRAALLPLFTYAAGQSARGVRKFINLDMEEYRDLDLTVSVFTGLLDRPELRHLEAGIVLQAYLPDALPAMQRLQAWAAARRASGGAPIKVRLVKGANLPMERVEASLRGWPLATFATKQETDTHYKRVLRWAMTPERLANVRLGVAGHNLFDVAYAWTLMGQRGVRGTGSVEFEMLLGMAAAQAAVVRETVGDLLLYVPVVHPAEFDVAIAYLVRRLEEGASQDNFMSAVFDLDHREDLFQRERARFAASLAAIDDEVPPTHRAQSRLTPPAGDLDTGFSNAPDTDPATAANRSWAAAVRARIDSSNSAADLVRSHTVSTRDELEAVLVRAMQSPWGRMPTAERARILRGAAARLEAHRADLLEVMASECGKTLDQGDPEVSEAVDFARYYATLSTELDEVDGARHKPVGVTVVAPPWNFPVAIPAGSVLAALAAGSTVILKPAPQAKRSGSLMAQALWEAGVPADALQLTHVDEGDLGRSLVADQRVDRLILTGAYATAELFRSFRPDIQLLAETSGKNAMVITPSADLDLAVKDLVASAFGHAGQKCSAASLAILVGGVARSRRFRRQLVDAVSSLVVAMPADPRAQVGPLIEPAAGKLLAALTQLAPGERWLLQPRQLDDEGRLWSPGIKEGVRPGSETHLVEFFGPVLGLIEVSDLDEALTVQNAVAYGLTAGIHSLDPAEVRTWLGQVQAGNAYVNRSTVGAIVQRQPFGGWKKSSVGAGSKAGGPSYLIGLSDWEPAEARHTARPSEAVARVLDRLGALDPQGRVARGAGSDAAALVDVFATRDVSGLAPEHNWLRHLPVPVTIRWEGGSAEDVVRVLLAGLAAGSSVTVSVPRAPDADVQRLVESTGFVIAIEDDAAWSQRLRGPEPPQRVRLIGGSREAFAVASGGRPDIALYGQPVTESGRLELLPFLHEQAVSVTAHRFGSPVPAMSQVLDPPAGVTSGTG